MHRSSHSNGTGTGIWDWVAPPRVQPANNSTARTWPDAVLQAEQLPAGVANLNTRLSDVQDDDLTHGGEYGCLCRCCPRRSCQPTRCSCRLQSAATHGRCCAVRGVMGVHVRERKAGEQPTLPDTGARSTSTRRLADSSLSESPVVSGRTLTKHVQSSKQRCRGNHTTRHLDTSGASPCLASGAVCARQAGDSVRRCGGYSLGAGAAGVALGFDFLFAPRK